MLMSLHPPSTPSCASHVKWVSPVPCREMLACKQDNVQLSQQVRELRCQLDAIMSLAGEEDEAGGALEGGGDEGSALWLRDILEAVAECGAHLRSPSRPRTAGGRQRASGEAASPPRLRSSEIACGSSRQVPSLRLQARVCDCSGGWLVVAVKAAAPHARCAQSTSCCP